MTQYNQFIYSGTLVHPNIVCLGLIRASFDAWFARNEFLTELTLAISGVHFSFATIFHFSKFVRIRSYSKIKLSHGCSLQW